MYRDQFTTAGSSCIVTMLLSVSEWFAEPSAARKSHGKVPGGYKGGHMYIGGGVLAIIIIILILILIF